MFHRRWRSFACCALAGLGLGCLDAGPTPLGRHLVAGRAPDEVQLVDGPVGAPRRVLLLRAHPDPAGFGFSNQEISTVDDPGPGAGPAAPRVIADDLGLQGSCATPSCATPIDSRGRLYLIGQYLTKLPGDPPGFEQHQTLVRVDPVTGEQHDFGETLSVVISADRTRVVFEPWPPPPVGDMPSVQPPFVVIDADDTETMLPGDGLLFAGDNLYYVSDYASDARELRRLAKGSVTPETVTEGVDGVLAYETDRGLLLGLSTFRDVMMGASYHVALFDPATNTRLTLPPVTAMATAFAPSPSGRYIATQGPPPTSDNPATELTIFDRDTGQEAVASQQNGIVSLETWRPHHDEAWFVGIGDDVFRWKPDGLPENVGHGPSPSGYAILGLPSSQEIPLGQQPVFTPDGQFRFVLEGFQSDREPIDLQSADDATAPPFRLNQPNMGIAGLWPLGDGQLLVENWLTDSKRNDIYLVDPVARAQRELATTGNVVAAGRDRCLALLHWVASGGSGDLTIVDYATGAQTLIAQNVHSVAVDASGDPGDALAPGTRVAFLVRNRIASPYDGLWVIDLP